MEARTRAKHTFSVEGVSWLEQLYGFLVTDHVDTPQHNILVPDTVVFRYQRPAALYLNEDRILSSSHELKDLSADSLLHRFASKDAAERICGTYVYINRDHHGERSDTQDVVVEYMNTEQLEFFLKHRTKHHNGILQRFIPSKGAYHTIIRVMWTPRTCHIETRSNKHRMDDTKVKMEDRIKTFDGSAELSTSHTLRDGLFYGRIKENVVNLVRHVESLVQKNYHVWETVMYFKYSQPEKGSEEKTGLTFLWCTSMRLYKDELLDLQRLDRFWASAMKTERLLSKEAPDRERKALACPLSGAVYKPGQEVTVAVKTMVKYLQALAAARTPSEEAILYMQEVADLDERAANEELIARRGREYTVDMLNEEVTSMLREDKSGKMIMDLVKRAVFGHPSEQEAERLRLILSHPKFLEQQIPVSEEVALQSAQVVQASTTQRAKPTVPLRLVPKKGAAGGSLAPASVIEVKNIQVGLLGTSGNQKKLAGSNLMSSTTKTLADGSRRWHSGKVGVFAGSHILSLRRQRYLPLGRRQAEYVSQGEVDELRGAIARGRDPGEEEAGGVRGAEAPGKQRASNRKAEAASREQLVAEDDWAAPGGASRGGGAAARRADNGGEAQPEGRPGGGEGGQEAGKVLRSMISEEEIAALRQEWEGGQPRAARGARRMLEQAEEEQGGRHSEAGGHPQGQSAGGARGGAVGAAWAEESTAAGGTEKAQEAQRAAALAQYAAFQATAGSGGEEHSEAGSEHAEEGGHPRSRSMQDSAEEGAEERRKGRGALRAESRAWERQRALKEEEEGEEGRARERAAAAGGREESERGGIRDAGAWARDSDARTRRARPGTAGQRPWQSGGEGGGRAVRPVSAKAVLTAGSAGGAGVQARRPQRRVWSAGETLRERREWSGDSESEGSEGGGEGGEAWGPREVAGMGRGGRAEELRGKGGTRLQQPGMDRRWSAQRRETRERERGADGGGQGRGGGKWVGEEWSDGDLIEDEDEEDWDDGLEMDLPSTYAKLRESQERRSLRASGSRRFPQAAAPHARAHAPSSGSRPAARGWAEREEGEQTEAGPSRGAGAAVSKASRVAGGRHSKGGTAAAAPTQTRLGAPVSRTGASAAGSPPAAPASRRRDAAAGAGGDRMALAPTARGGGSESRTALRLGSAKGLSAAIAGPGAAAARGTQAGRLGGQTRVPLFLQWQQDDRARSKVLEQYSAFAGAAEPASG